jgi:hypothetical protein
LLIAIALSGTLLLLGCNNSNSSKAPPLRVEKTHPDTGGAARINGARILVTATGGTPITITRIVFNNREGVPQCDLSANTGRSTEWPNKALSTGDTFSWYFDNDAGCGTSLVRVDIYTDQGAANYTFDE